jgi:hypothetical protein
MEFWRLARLFDVLDMDDPVDQEIFENARDGELLVGFVEVSE